MLFLLSFFSCRAGFLDYVRSWFLSNNYERRSDLSAEREFQNAPPVPERRNAPIKNLMSKQEEKKEEKQVSKKASKFSGSEETVFMAGGLPLHSLYLLNMMQRNKLSAVLIDHEMKLNQFYIEMVMDEKGKDRSFLDIFNDVRLTALAKALIWNIDFTDPVLLYHRFKQKFGDESLLQYGINDEEGLSKIFLPDGNKKYRVTAAYIQQVAHQSEEKETNNCGLHALINAQLFCREEDNKKFIENYDTKIGKARDILLQKYIDEGKSEKDKEQVLVGSLEDEELDYVAKDWFSRNDKNQIVLMDVQKMIHLMKGTINSFYIDWNKHFQGALKQFDKSRQGKIAVVFNMSSYSIGESIKNRLQFVSDNVEDAEERKNIDREILNIFEERPSGHWITVLFKKIGNRDIEVTLADSLGSHTADAAFLQLWFLEQLNQL